MGNEVIWIKEKMIRNKKKVYEVSEWSNRCDW